MVQANHVHYNPTTSLRLQAETLWRRRPEICVECVAAEVEQKGKHIDEFLQGFVSWYSNDCCKKESPRTSKATCNLTMIKFVHMSYLDHLAYPFRMYNPDMHKPYKPRRLVSQGERSAAKALLDSKRPHSHGMSEQPRSQKPFVEILPSSNTRTGCLEPNQLPSQINLMITIMNIFLKYCMYIISEHARSYTYQHPCSKPFSRKSRGLWPRVGIGIIFTWQQGCQILEVMPC